LLNNKTEVNKLISSLTRYFESEGNLSIVEILTHSCVSSECIDYDGRDGGNYIYALYLEIEIKLFARHRSLLNNYEKEILETIDMFLRGEANEHFVNVIIRPIRKQYLNWAALAGKVEKKDIISTINDIKSMMIAVSTGGPRIQDKNDSYIESYKALNTWLITLGLENSNPHKDLWDWYGRWSQSDLSTYASRRAYVASIYDDTIENIEKSDADLSEGEYTPTGWERVDRTVYEMKQRLIEAKTEEQFQAIGMLGREAIITIAQQVFNRDIHKTEDGVIPSDTDAKRMLDAYFSCELSGSSNERVRKYSRASLDLANNLTHDRLATMRDASLCLTAVVSLAYTVKIISQHSELLL
jgi:hypothetical protein